MSSGVSTAVMSALLAVEGKCVTSAEGIIGGGDMYVHGIRNLTAMASAIAFSGRRGHGRSDFVGRADCER